MSKTNTSLLRQPAVTLDSIIDNLDQLATETGLIKRRTPGFSAEGFLLTLLKAVTTGQASFKQMTINLFTSQSKSLSPQAVHHRFNQSALDYLNAVKTSLENNPVKSLYQDHHSMPFRRILAQDASQIRMHPKNEKHYRAVANNSGPTSGAKIDVIEDVLTGQLFEIAEVEGHVQDKTLGPRLLDFIKKDDLILRDMGYFDVSGFAEIEVKDAWWISRLHAQAGAFLTDGTELEKVLSTTSEDILDFTGIPQVELEK